jgi:hypothetical protein
MEAYLMRKMRDFAVFLVGAWQKAFPKPWVYEAYDPEGHERAAEREQRWYPLRPDR